MCVFTIVSKFVFSLVMSSAIVVFSWVVLVIVFIMGLSASLPALRRRVYLHYLFLHECLYYTLSSWVSLPCMCCLAVLRLWVCQCVSSLFTFHYVFMSVFKSVHVSSCIVETQKVAALSLCSGQEGFQFQIWQNNVMLSDVRKKPPDDGVKSEDGK